MQNSLDDFLLTNPPSLHETIEVEDVVLFVLSTVSHEGPHLHIARNNVSMLYCVELTLHANVPDSRQPGVEVKESGIASQLPQHFGICEVLGIGDASNVLMRIRTT